jgi:aspartyl-tRNA synthetase
MVFFELRQSTDTVQALLQQSNEVSKQMVKWAGSITAESIVLIRGKVQKSPIEINATTIKDAEIHIAEVPYPVHPLLTIDPYDLCLCSPAAVPD